MANGSTGAPAMAARAVSLAITLGMCTFCLARGQCDLQSDGLDDCSEEELQNAVYDAVGEDAGTLLTKLIRHGVALERPG
jgi:hypothetical protein